MNSPKSANPNNDNLRKRLRKTQEWVRAPVPPKISLVDELIAERREEARREFDSESE
jgi:hypothetical protein